MKLTITNARDMHELDMEVAVFLCTGYLDSAEDDLSHMSHKQIDVWMGRVAEAASMLMEIGDEWQQALGERVKVVGPALWDYDTNGNFVGTVANENGWTA